MLDGWEWEFELGDEDRGGRDEGGCLVDFGRSEFEAGAGDDNDGVFTFGGVDEDSGGPGGVGGGKDKLRIDALVAVEGAGDLAEGVGAKLGDEGDGGSGAGGGYCLVGSLASGAELEGLAHEGFSPAGEAVDSEGEVSDVAAHNGDALDGHSVVFLSWNVAASSGDSISSMPIDAKVQAILDAARGGKPIELQTPEEARAARAEMMRRFVPMPEYAGVRVQERALVVDNRAGGREIAMRVYRPEAATGTLPVVVYFHGGGFVMGTLETHDPYCRGLTTEAGVMVVSVDYRLAPEHKFPAGVEDCFAATEWVLKHVGELGGDERRVFVAGDSAGGTMATVVALLLRDRGGAGRLAGQILLYPVTRYCDPPSGVLCGDGAGIWTDAEGNGVVVGTVSERRERGEGFSGRSADGGVIGRAAEGVRGDGGV